MTPGIRVRATDYSTDVTLDAGKPGLNVSLYRRRADEDAAPYVLRTNDAGSVTLTIHGYGFEASAEVEADALRAATMVLTSDVGDAELRVMRQIAAALTDPFLAHWLTTWVERQRGAIVKAGAA